jgi:hypothetical protein
MALKLVIDKIEDVEPVLRPHYTEDNGKFTLATQGEHPMAAKVAEFRSNNIALQKTVTELQSRFEGIDPEAVKADRGKIATLEAQVAAAPTRITELETQLATEKTARTKAEARADRGVLNDALRTHALSAGVLPAALELLLDKAAPVFEVKDGVVQARPNTFSPSRPGELITPSEWVASAVQEFPFLFAPSSGGGANPRRGAGGGDGKKVLTNPTPRELGAHASEIAKGTVRVEYSDAQGV